MTDKYFCFDAYEDNEQEEAGDTLQHTFIKEPWPVCQTRFFYFHGTINGIASPSTSPILKKHRVAPPPEPITAYFYPDPSPEITCLDGYVEHSGGKLTWPELHAAPGNTAYTNSLRNNVYFNTYFNIGWWYVIARTIILFDTSSIPIGSTIISATLRIHGESKVDDLAVLPALNVYGSHPLSNTSLDPSDYQRTYDIPFSTQVEYNDFLIDMANYWPFNQDGLNAIVPGGITKLALREAKYDAPNISPLWTGGKNSQMHTHSRDKSQALGPRLEVTYQP